MQNNMSIAVSTIHRLCIILFLAPLSPTNIKATDIQSNSITIAWINGPKSITTTYVKYKKVGKSDQGFNIVCGQTPIVVNGLQSSTEYEFQVGVYSSMYGGSEWSAKYMARTLKKKGGYALKKIHFLQILLRRRESTVAYYILIYILVNF